MEPQRTLRRSVKHYHEPGDLHELTFSCFHRMPLLGNDTWRRMLAESVDRATQRYGFSLVAFVFMPEHVHLLVSPDRGADIEEYLAAMKRPYSYRIKQILVEQKSSLLKKLIVPDKRKGSIFHCWQKGPGYDRNLQTAKAVLSSIDYIHMNPVRRSLCQRADDWKWSSARWYLNDGGVVDSDLPTIHGLTVGLLDT